MIKDMVGNVVNIGDSVVVTEKNYRNMVLAKVERITKTGVRVRYLRSTDSEHTSYFTTSFVKVIKE